MSKMLCRCGHAISDSSCPCPTEASVIGDLAYDTFDRVFTHRVNGFLDAVRDGRRRDWIVAELSPQYPLQDSDGEVISALLTATLFNYCLGLAECPKCGRLWIQRGIGVSNYRSFSPDDSGFDGHLSAIPGPATPDA